MPESLGNTEHVLPRGSVCDQCNNYFARKIEKTVLDCPLFRNPRSRQWIKSKNGNVPYMHGWLLGSNQAALIRSEGAAIEFSGHNESETSEIIKSIIDGRTRGMIIPFPKDETADEKVLARFLGKVAIEALALRLSVQEGWQEYVVQDCQLDEIRRFVRVGDRPSSWPFSRRRIYDEDHFHDIGGQQVQTLHEWTFLYTEANELFCIICVFGEEFAINLAGPEIDGYQKWLAENDGKSPLYLKEELPISASAITARTACT